MNHKILYSMNFYILFLFILLDIHNKTKILLFLVNQIFHPVKDYKMNHFLLLQSYHMIQLIGNVILVNHTLIQCSLVLLL